MKSSTEMFTPPGYSHDLLKNAKASTLRAIADVKMPDGWKVLIECGEWYDAREFIARVSSHITMHDKFSYRGSWVATWTVESVQADIDAVLASVAQTMREKIRLFSEVAE